MAKALKSRVNHDLQVFFEAGPILLMLPKLLLGNFNCSPMRKKLLFLLAVIISYGAFSQDFSNKGKDFWVGYGSHCDMYNANGTLNATGGAQDMVLYFATEAITTVTVSIPGLGYSQTYSNIPANTIFETAPIPKTGANDARLGTEGTSNKGIHITSDKPIVGYAHIYNGSRSGATLLFPTTTLGKEYYSVNMSQYSQQAYSYCFFFVVATDTGTTTIQVTPSANTQTMTAGTMYTLNLTQGQVFNALGTITGNSGVDLTGSKIMSVASGNSNCKRIAVFSGSGKINLSCPIGAGGSADNYIVQSFPKTAWGKNYLTVPTAGMPFNYFRIAVTDPATVVKLNGVVMTGLINNFYYQIAATNQPNYIQSDKPIMVSQYITTTGACGNNVGIPANEGDPEVIYLSPIEQNISSVLVNSTPHYAINEHFISVLIPNGGTAISSFLLDGASLPVGSFLTHPQNSNYSYLQRQVAVGIHSLRSDSGFNASAYGYGNVESYGYNAGCNIKDLYQQIGVSTQYGIETTPSVCTNAPFRFKVSLPYIPDSMYWDFQNASGMLPNNTNVMVNTPVADSITVVNTRTIYWYSLPTYYNFTAVGTYPITITTYAPNTEGCGTVQSIDFDLVVSNPPIADFSWVAGGCDAEPYQFTETTPQSPKPTYHFWWNFDDPGSGVNNTSLLRNPAHIFSSPGTHNVRFSDITTPGCLSDTIVHQVIVAPLPSATISGTATVCINDPQPVVTFTGSGGTPPYTFYYHINGGGVQTVATVGASVTATINVPTTPAGTYIYTLDSIRNTGSTVCVQQVSGQTATVIVRPDATITLSSAPGTDDQTVCIDSSIININYAIGGSGNGAAITAGGLPAGVTGSYSGGVFTISGTPSVSGVFNYTVTTLGPCVNVALTGRITVDANSTITLTSFPATTNQFVCRLSAIADITYFISSGGTGASIIAGGLPAGVTGVYNAGVFTISGTPTISGVFNYTVGTSGPCVNPSLSGTITVWVLPTPNFAYNSPSCETRTISFTDGSVANVGLITAWAWDFNDPASGTSNTSPLQNPTHTFANAGVYNVSLTVTTTNGCVSIPAAVIPVTINARPLAGYIIPEVCLSDTYAQFLDTSKVAAPSTIIAWAWDFGDPVSGPLNTSTLQNPQHSYSAVGPYNVQLIVTSNTGCKDTIMQVLTVNGSFPIAIFNVNNPANLCANDSVAIVDQSIVFPGLITQVEIIWDLINFPGVVQVDPNPFFGKTYRHLYPNFQAPLTKPYTIRLRAYSGGVCLDDTIKLITVNAAPLVQFNNMPDTCLLAAPFQLTQGSEIGGVPGSGAYSGPGVSPTGIFSPGIAGVGLHTLLYTFTSTAAGCIDTMSSMIRVLDTAHALFSYSTPACNGFPITFTEQSTVPAGIILFNTVWDFGDGSPVENHLPGSIFTHLFPAANTYVVTMFNTSAYGCNSTVYTKPVVVEPNHTISLTSGAGSDNPTTCINVSISPITYTLGGGATGATVTGLPAGMTYTIAGTTLTILGAPTTTTGSPFSFLIVTTGNACTIADTTGSITVSADHSITLTSGIGSNIQRVCLNTAISPITYGIGGGASGFTIAGLPPGVTAVQVGNTIAINGSPGSTAGTPYRYIITTTGNNCLTTFDTGRINVSPYPVPLLSLDKAAYCIPNAVVAFNNSSTIEDGTENAFTYLWDFGEPSSGALNTSLAKSPAHWYSGTGPFTVKLSITSLWGCVHDTTFTLSTIHPQPKAGFSTDTPFVCINDLVTFTDRTDYKDGTPGLWNWDMGDGGIRDLRTFAYKYRDTITFFVSFYTVNSFGCNSDTITKPFTVYPYPKVNAGNDRMILEGGTIQLDAFASGNDLLFLWTPNRYLDNDRKLSPAITRPETDMTYRLTVTARGGCKLSDDIFVKLLKFPVIPNTFTPNNDGINDSWRIDYLDTYPGNRVQVFTRTGQLVFESKGYAKPWDGTYKGRPLPVDTYYYFIEPGNGRLPITGYVTIIK